MRKAISIKIDSKLRFDYHTGNICKKADTKSNAFTRVPQYMDTKKG